MNRIIWLPRAEQNYMDILDEISKSSVNRAFSLDRAIDKLMAQLRSFKYSCPESLEKKGYRRCVVLKHYSMTYRVREETIYVISFSDNRRRK